MENTSTLKSNAIWLLFGFIVAVFCFRQIREPDLWWQVTTGSYIIENREVPKTDVFSFTFEGTEWINVKWGSEVLQALISNNLGIEFMPVFQWIATMLTIYCVFLIFRLQVKERYTVEQKWFFIAAAFFGIIIISFRLNARPEMASHLFTFVFILLFERILRGHYKWAFALIPIQIIWANMHEGFGMGMVISGVYLINLWIRKKDFLSTERGSAMSLLLVSGLIIASWFSVAIHPMGSQMILHPWNIFTQLGDNRFTTELFSWKMKEYWTFSSVLNLLLFLGTALYLYKQFKAKVLWKNYSLAYVFLFFAFFYLSINSYRNIPFFVWIAIPVAAAYQVNTNKSVSAGLKYGTVGLMLICYGLVVSNTYYNVILPGEKFGLKINPDKHPIGVSNYMKEYNIEGKAFTDYIISSYLMWDHQPDFKTFVDLRDLDIYNVSFIQTVFRCLAQPTYTTPSGEGIWDYLDSRAKFDYVVLTTNPQFVPLHRYLENGNVYTLAYEDKNSRLYLRNDGANSDLITPSFKRKWNKKLVEAPENKAATILSKVVWFGYKD